MANFDPAFLTELVTRVKAVWTDITEVARSTSADRVQLENELRSAVTSLPLGFIHIGGRNEDPNWGMQNQCYRYPTTIFYMGSISAVTAVAATFEAKMASLRDNLIGTATTAFQVIDYPTIYVEDSSDVNQTLVGIQEGLFCAELHLDILVGETL